MTKTIQVKLCMKCGAELPDPMPAACPSCQYQLLFQPNLYYGSPDYLYFQALTHKEGNNIDSPKVTDAEKKEYAKAIDALDVWARTCPDDDKIACFHDADHILVHLLHSNASIETMRHITGIARKLGDLATTIENYFANGGTTNVRTPQTRSKPGGQETNP